MDFLHACRYGRANNPHAGRNILATAVAGAGVAGYIYTGIAILNLEDGGGEFMLALRIAQAASNSEATIFTSEALEAVASASGKVDAIVAGFNAGGTGFAVGAGIGAGLTSPTCAGQ